MAFEDPLTIIATVLVVIVACVIVIYAMKGRRKKPKKATPSAKTEPEFGGLPFRVTKSVQKSDATHAKDELRILDLEREILSDSIRRLYEAHAEGKISEEERERLSASYKSRMNAVRDSIAKDETIVALHELENMREDLMTLFSERFEDLSSKVEELRSKIDVQPVKEISVKIPETTMLGEEEQEDTRKKTKKRRKLELKPSPKSEAEKRIEAIRSEVEKVLDKLGQMEIES